MHSGPECVETMLSIAKVICACEHPSALQEVCVYVLQVTSRSVSTLVHQRLEQAMQKMTSEESILAALSVVGLSQHGT